MTKISSRLYTVALKLFAFPVVMSPIFPLSGVQLRAHHSAGDVLEFFAGEIFCIFASVIASKYVLYLADGVYDDGEALLFRRKNSQTRVPLDKVISVSERNFPLPPTVTVTFALLHGIEDSRSFLPAEDQENITRDLLSRVTQAKANGKPR